MSKALLQLGISNCRNNVGFERTRTYGNHGLLRVVVVVVRVVVVGTCVGCVKYSFPALNAVGAKKKPSHPLAPRDVLGIVVGRRIQSSHKHLKFTSVPFITTAQGRPHFTRLCSLSATRPFPPALAARVPPSHGDRQRPHDLQKERWNAGAHSRHHHMDSSGPTELTTHRHHPGG